MSFYSSLSKILVLFQCFHSKNLVVIYCFHSKNLVVIYCFHSKKTRVLIYFVITNLPIKSFFLLSIYGKYPVRNQKYDRFIISVLTNVTISSIPSSLLFLIRQIQAYSSIYLNLICYRQNQWNVALHPLPY